MPVLSLLSQPLQAHGVPCFESRRCTEPRSTYSGWKRASDRVAKLFATPPNQAGDLGKAQAGYSQCTRAIRRHIHSTPDATLRNNGVAPNGATPLLTAYANDYLLCRFTSKIVVVPLYSWATTRSGVPVGLLSSLINANPSAPRSPASLDVTGFEKSRWLMY